MRRSRACRITTATLVAVVGIILLNIFRILTILFFAFGLEDKYTKWYIQNPYVNSHFTGWREIVLYDTNTVMIPNEWSFADENCDGIFSITDGEGKLWATGTLFGTEGDVFEDYSEFVASLTAIQPESVTIESYNGFVAMNASMIKVLTAQYSDGVNTYYCLELHRPGTNFLFILYSDISQSPSDYDIAEAIIYSFAYET